MEHPLRERVKLFVSFSETRKKKLIGGMGRRKSLRKEIAEKKKKRK